jgi:hypothetical protein
MPTEDWELSSGLRDDLIFDIHLATFGYRANYNNGASMLLILAGTDEATEPFEHILSIGADWFSPDSRHIQHPSGKNKINQQSRYGRWIRACQKIEPLWSYLINSPGPTDASIWENLRLHLTATEQVLFRGAEPRQVLEPVEFLGFLNDPSIATGPGPTGGLSSVASQPSPLPPPLQPSLQPVTPPPAPSQPVAVGPTPEQMLANAQAAAGLIAPDSPTHIALTAMARNAPDHNTFVGQAFAVQGVSTDPELIKRLMDPNDYFLKARTNA